MIVCAFLVTALPALHALPDYLTRSDELSRADRNVESSNLLMRMLPTARTDAERAEIYWRLSRDTLVDGDSRRWATSSPDSFLSFYSKGESYADKAIALDPDNSMGYYLKACNIGRLERAQGANASLARAELMRRLLVKAVLAGPLLSGPWYVLGQLYEQVPAWPISFGNTAWAVSLGRKALDAGMTAVSDGVEHDVPLDYSIQLARHLAKRDWSTERRVQEQAIEARKFTQTSDVVERNFYYEGVISIQPVSDRTEARQLCQEVIAKIGDGPRLTWSQRADLENARATLASLGK